MSFDLSSASPRRSSTSSSISIKVETCTTSSSLPTYDILERRIPPIISTTIEPSPPPAVHLSTSSSNSSYSYSMINVPPPAYQFPPTSSSTTTTPDINPLSFYSFPPPSSSSSSSSTPSQTLPFSTLTRISNDNNVSPPPEYSQVPQTFSERCFVFGFLCPLIWLIGFSKYFYSATNRFSSTCIKDLEAGVGSLEENELERILESLESWREEEKLWSLRCGWCFGGFLSLGLLAGIVIAAVIGGL